MSGPDLQYLITLIQKMAVMQGSLKQDMEIMKTNEQAHIKVVEEVGKRLEA
jgi:hypothetical protein